MRFKKKKFPLLENIEITGIAAEGKAIAKISWIYSANVEMTSTLRTKNSPAKSVFKLNGPYVDDMKIEKDSSVDQKYVDVINEEFGNNQTFLKK